jgi:hypothetical protein
LLLSVFVGAAVLAQTVSLSLALLAVVPVSALGGLALLTFNAGFLDTLLSLFDAWIEALQAGDNPLEMVRPTMGQVAGLMAVGNALMVSLCVLLGRYWQSELYKPGAFGEEFRALKLPSFWVVVLVVVTVVGAMSSGDWAAWSALAGIPITVCGFALLHSIARDRKLGGGFLTVSYVLWAFVDVLKVGVLVAVLLDAFIDLGRRVKPN